MKITSLEIPDIKIIQPNIFQDERGYFYESYNSKKLSDLLDKEIFFFQDNQSFSKKNVLRGLHFQLPPYAQGKLIRVLQGEIFDVAVDLRKSSSTYGQWVGYIVDDKEQKQIWIPEGFAHGFYCLKDSLVQYKSTNQYSLSHEVTLRWDDPYFQIKWPFSKLPFLSQKDMMGEFFDIKKPYFN